MEGIAIDYYKDELVDALADPNNEDALVSVFHSFLSDDSEQNAAATAANSSHLISLTC